MNFAGIIVTGAGAILSYSGFLSYRNKRLIEDTPTSKVRSLAIGDAEVYGEVVPIHSYTTPFTHGKCVYCKWTIEEWKKQGKNHAWVTIRSGKIGDRFYLQDDTGKVLVDPKEADIDIKRDFQYSGDPTKDKKILDFLEKNNISYKGWIFTKKMRFREDFIAPGDKVFIMGRAGKDPQASPSEKNEDTLMMQRGTFYYISDKSEKDVLTSHMWRMILSIGFGGLLLALGLWLMFR